MNELTGSYADILTLPHYEPRRPRMSRQARAAQFAPFDALNGYSAAIKEAADRHISRAAPARAGRKSTMDS